MAVVLIFLLSNPLNNKTMKEVFVIEQMVALGYWELMSDIFYTDEKEAVDMCLKAMQIRQQTDKNYCARVTKLKLKE